jgi:uncharacterized protein with PQ loop repeat
MLSMIYAGFMFFCIKIAPVVASYVITYTYLPQIWRTLKTKNVDGISLQFWFFLTIFLICMVCNAWGLFLVNGASVLGYLITEIINFVLGFVQFILVIIFGKEGRKKARAEKKANKVQK